MLNSDFWHDLSAQFTALSVASNDWLWADWQYVSGSKMAAEWQVRGGGAMLAMQFEALARRGAAAITNDRSADLLITWLELLRTELNALEIQLTAVERDEDGTEVAHRVIGNIPSLCSTSARMCKELENRALEKEFASPQSEQPPHATSQGFDSSDDSPEPLASPLTETSVEGEHGVLMPSQRIWRKDGDYWTVTFEGETKLLKNQLGMVYLSYLLISPWKEIPAPELIAAAAGQTSKPPKSSAGEIADSRAVSEYEVRSIDLAAELAQARRNNDVGRVAILGNEIEMINNAITSAKGLGGRPRKVGDTGDRARKSVGQAVSRAIKSIRRTNVALAKHLKDRVKFGVSLLYKGDEIPWNSK